MSQEKDDSNHKQLKVAIMDSGINKSHPDLNIQEENSVNFVELEKKVIDDFGHGTAIAGIIAAQNNDFGIQGIAPNVEIFDLKVLDEKGKGSIDDFIKAVEWCITNEIDVINVSFGFQTENERLKEVIKRALDYSIIIVAAAGNTYGLGVEYPAKYEGVISVNSINQDLKLLNSSASGKIDFVAPGFEVLSTDKAGGYSTFTGTSFAAAYITGAISKLLQENSFNKNLGENIVIDLGENDYDSSYGYGFLKIK
ncbi:S8 family serine peptidase [Lysinibacillus sp. NPDC048646]|uniref:S8 family serine peptidase n=1 Tax=Lysinibacillus sp. NPDC048646 TaxID=3390574 RepID=UPI003D05DFC6